MTKKGSADATGQRCYECKTCSKRFDTYQALGGHQGIHKKVDQFSNIDHESFLSLAAKSSRMHRCKMCMKEFETGPALGGHMTLHRFEKDSVTTERRCQPVHAAVESDVMMAAVELPQLKDEEDEGQKMRSELILAAKEWRLSLI